MPAPRVLVTRPLPGTAVARLSREAEVELWPGPLPPPPEALRARVADKDGLLCLLTERVDAALLAAAPSLRAVSTMAVGVDHVDVAACTARRIPVGHTPGVLTETSADFAFALLLALARRVAEGDAYVRAGHWRTWEPGLLLGADVHGATLGLLGLGAIGQAVARRARGFGMRVLAVTRTRRPDVEARLGVEVVDKARLLAESDFVSLHAPLTPETRGWVGAAELAALKPGALLVNTGRGPLVDPAALDAALRAGTLAGAALDVTDPEPLPPGHPLMTAPRLLLAPHIASASVATRGRMADMAVDNLLAALAGRRPPNCVNPELFQVTTPEMTQLERDVRARVRDVQDFPKPGILFKDLTPVLADPALFGRVVQAMAAPFQGQRVRHVVGMEARGFMFGAPVALALGAGFIPARKPGKLPWRTERHAYALEYGQDSLEVHADCLAPGERVLVVDDLLATGGTAAATEALIRKLGGEVVGFSFAVKLDSLRGEDRLGARAHAVVTYGR